MQSGKCNHRSTAMQKKKKKEKQCVSAIIGYSKRLERKVA